MTHLGAQYEAQEAVTETSHAETAGHKRSTDVSSASAIRALPRLLPKLMKCGCNARKLQEPMLRLQHLIGNRAVQQLIASSGAGAVHPETEDAINSARGGGQPLNATIRRTMESHTGADLSGVRVHTGPHAHELNEAVGARAFTVGSDIFFGKSEFRPETAEGDHLLAHELTHVIQQNGGRGTVSRVCKECEEKEAQAKLAVGAADDPYEREADAVAAKVVQLRKLEPSMIQASEAETITPGSAESPIRRVPAPGRDFGTPNYCGFGITTPIPGFIKGLMTNGFDVDYTTGCTYVGANAWSSVWELYDASNHKLDSDRESPHGKYTIPADKINAGTPSDGSSSKWSLWYRITKSNPWVTGDNDAYPYDYKTFDVYSDPVKDPRTTLTEETGPVIWQNNFTPAEDGASLDYTITTAAQRSTSDSQTTSVSGTVGGSQEAHIGFTYDGLTGGFSRNLSYSATASISRTHSVDVSTSKTETFTFHQPNLRAGITYRVVAKPLYHVINGSVQLISERDGVISSVGNRIEGGIRMLKGLDIQVLPSAAQTPDDEPREPGDPEVLVKKTCWAGRNCTGRAYGKKFSHCHNCKNAASGKSLGEPGACENC